MVLAYSLISFLLLLRYLSQFVDLRVVAILSSIQAFQNVELIHNAFCAATLSQALWCQDFGKPLPLTLLTAGIGMRNVSMFVLLATLRMCIAKPCMQPGHVHQPVKWHRTRRRNVASCWDAFRILSLSCLPKYSDSLLSVGLYICRYGVLMSSSLHVSLFMLLSALVLQIFKYSVGPSINECAGQCCVLITDPYLLLAAVVTPPRIVWAMFCESWMPCMVFCIKLAIYCRFSNQHVKS